MFTDGWVLFFPLPPILSSRWTSNYQEWAKFGLRSASKVEISWDLAFSLATFRNSLFNYGNFWLFFPQNMETFAQFFPIFSNPLYTHTGFFFVVQKLDQNKKHLKCTILRLNQSLPACPNLSFAGLNIVSKWPQSPSWTRHHGAFTFSHMLEWGPLEALFNSGNVKLDSLRP